MIDNAPDTDHKLSSAVRSRPRRKAAEAAAQRNAKVFERRVSSVKQKTPSAATERRPEELDAAQASSDVLDDDNEPGFEDEIRRSSNEWHTGDYEETESDREDMEMSAPPKKRMRFGSALPAGERHDGLDADDGNGASTITQSSLTSTEPASSASARARYVASYHHVALTSPQSSSSHHSLVVTWSEAVIPGVPSSPASLTQVGHQSFVPTHGVALSTSLQVSPDAAATTAPNPDLHGPVVFKQNTKFRREAKVSDLPDAARVDDAWTRVFLPTLLRYLGARSDPWFWQRSFAVSTLQAIWAAVYGEDLPFPLAMTDSILALVSRLDLSP